jgi:hypothetical protein
MDGDKPDPCEELLSRFQTAHAEEVERDVGEVITIVMIISMYAICVVLSVAVDLATALETLPALGMVSYHKREAIKTAARKVPVRVTRKP